MKGTPQPRRGSTGRNVELVQFWLSSLAQYSTTLPDVAVDGNYGAATERAVTVFQRQNSLTADGVVGQATWDALYNAWVRSESDIGGTAWPGTVLRQGSRGAEVRLVQLWLRIAADNYSALNTVTVDGTYGAGTAAAVTAEAAGNSFAAFSTVTRPNAAVDRPHSRYPPQMNSLRLPTRSDSAPISSVVSVAAAALQPTIAEM